MGQSRLDFQRELRKHAPAAHYMRPAGNKMDYPCFVYKSIEPRQIRADNRNYLTIPGYEEEMTAAFLFCSAGAPYIADDLFHYPFTIYY